MASSDTSSVFLQHQIQKNADELHNYVRDLNHWEKEMKRKDEQLRSDVDVNPSKNIPPVRNKRSRDKSKEVAEEKKEEVLPKQERIKSYDYRSWEKFDVDKACAEISDEDEEKSNCPCDATDDTIQDDQELFKNKQQAILEKDRGNDFFKNGNYEEAIKCYTTGIQCDSYSAVLPANRAMAFIKQKNYTAAESDCSHSLSLDPTYVKAYLRRAKARMELGKLAEAKQDLTEVLKLEYNNKQALTDLETVKLKLDLKNKNSETKPETSRSLDISVFSKSNSSNISTSRLNSDAVNIVKPIYKPPHLRSKKPLIRIEVEEIYSDPEEISVSKINKSSQETTIPKSVDIPISSPDQEITPSIPHVPDLPKTEYQFQSSLKRLRYYPTQLFHYLKKIDPRTYPKLLQESMEFDVFSIILQYLYAELMPKEDDVFPHLYYLSKVKRFSALVLFISKDDKQMLTELFDYIKRQPTSNLDGIQELSSKYGL